MVLVGNADETKELMYFFDVTETMINKNPLTKFCKKKEKKSKCQKMNLFTSQCRVLFTSSTEAFQPINVFQITRQNSADELFRPYVVRSSESGLDWYTPRDLFTARDYLQPISVFNEFVNQQTEFQEYLVVPSVLF